MKIVFQKWITREDVRANPDNLYVFGDNLKRVGMGGQAAAMRGEPNAFGVATKRAPGMNEQDFFSDQPDEIDSVVDDLLELHTQFFTNTQYKTIVWPSDGIGTGLAELPERSPIIYSIIQNFIKEYSNG